MKKRVLRLFAVLSAAFIAALNVSAVIPKLSPALDNISVETVMVKSAKTGNDVLFTTADFSDTLGTLPAQIKLTKLPDSESGKLMLGSTEIFVGQTVSSANFSLLRFVPASETVSSSFEFTSTGNYSTKCIIRLSEIQNTSPIAVMSACAVTQTDITCYGSMYGYDADGDKLNFEIVSYPSKGLLEVIDRSFGSFTYTPYDGAIGTDCFSYKVKDEFGNYSDECIVNLEIRKRAFDAELADMDGHWAHNAALAVIADGSMDMISEMGKFYFDPQEYITREDYLKAVMNSLGATEIPDVVTVFADDSLISEGLGGYVAAAYKLGIIKGEAVNGKLYFRPDEPISKAEASVILNRILGAQAEALPVFSDFDETPAWAESDIRALSSVGILSGNENLISPMKEITRAEAAQMIYAAKNLYQ